MTTTHHGIFLHFVFSTKQRFPLLADEWRDELFGYMGGTAKEHRAVLIRAGGVEDHVHLLAKIHPAFAIAETVKLIKANSSRWINDNRKVNAKFSWQRGYGVFSVSKSQLENVESYVANQREHHKQQSFQDEYLALLRKHQIQFDEKYVFDDERVYEG